MRGYFQRLMNLTGIVPADRRPNMVGGRLAGTMPHLQADAVPIHLEVAKYVAPSPHHIAPQALGDSVAILNQTASARLEGQDLPIIATPASEGGLRDTGKGESEPVTLKTEKSELPERIIIDGRYQANTGQESGEPNERLTTSRVADSVIGPSRQSEEDIKSRLPLPELSDTIGAAAALIGTMPRLEADAVPIHIKETKYVASAPHRIAPQVSGDSVAILSRTALAPQEGQDLPVIAMPAPEGGLRNTERGKSVPVMQKAEKAKLAERLIKNEWDQASASQESSEPNKRLSTGRVADNIIGPSWQGEQDVKGRPSIPEVSESIGPAAGKQVIEFRTDESTATALNSKPGPGRSETDQITLKEVLDWVSATPFVSDTEPSSQSERQIENFGQHPLAVNPAPPSFAVRPLMTETSPAPPPEVHDFHLTIGTISLTIEEPKGEMAPIQPQQAAPERTAPPASSGASRLRRHYLRIR